MIRNIIFDFGGVVLNIDYSLSIKAFEKLGIGNAASMYSQSEQILLFDQLEEGLISPGEFRFRLKVLTSQNLTDEQIDDAWNAMILDLPCERISLLKNCRRHYRTFLLSNSNAIHYKKYTADLKKIYGYSSFSELFEKVYFSHELKMKKPSSEIFRKVMNDNMLNADETLFIDDTQRHIEGAGKCGLQTYFLPPGENINRLFDGRGVLRSDVIRI